MRREFFEWRFRQAAGDYYALLNKRYPEKRSRHLIADRYHLNTAQRTVLYRGVFPDAVNRRRRELLIDIAEVRDHVLFIDFLNLVYLLMNYLYGRNLFSADSRIIDQCNAKVFDLAFYILDRNYKADFPRIIDLIAHTENSNQTE
jgi:hypothetical protein